MATELDDLLQQLSQVRPLLDLTESGRANMAAGTLLRRASQKWKKGDLVGATEDCQTAVEIAGISESYSQLAARALSVFTGALASAPNSHGGDLQIYLAKDGVQSGPYTLERIKERLAAKLFHLDEYWAWYGGAKGWIPLSEVPGLGEPLSVQTTLDTTSRTPASAAPTSAHIWGPESVRYYTVPRPPPYQCAVCGIVVEPAEVEQFFRCEICKIVFCPSHKTKLQGWSRQVSSHVMIHENRRDACPNGHPEIRPILRDANKILPFCEICQHSNRFFCSPEEMYAPPMCHAQNDAVVPEGTYNDFCLKGGPGCQHFERAQRPFWKFWKS